MIRVPLALTLTLLPALALAGEPTDARVMGGTPVAECAWPSVGALGAGGCMGTLIHPQIVITSGPCGLNHSSIAFGEDVANPAREYGVAYCRRNPAYASQGTVGKSQAYCVLEEAVTDIPVVPVAMGCESGLVSTGASLTMVGYGATSTGGATGIKSSTTASVLSGAGGEVLYTPGACLGDGGAPLFIELAEAAGGDGTWRLVAIADDTNDCDGTMTKASQVEPAIAWIEEDLGGAVDLTPCHDADGTWNPGPDCQMYPMGPGASAGTWAAGCDGGPAFDGYQALCGAPYNPPPGMDDGGETTDGGATDGGATDGGTTDAGDAGDASSGSETTGGTDEGGGGGCSVRGEGTGPASALALLGLLGLRRRRNA